MPYNVGMSHPEIIIPFALPPAEHAKDLVKLLASECGSEGLAMLLSRSRAIQRNRFDDFSPELPHEYWLSKQHQHSYLEHQKNKLSLTLPEGYWFVLHPVHLHIASNHLVLTDFRQLSLTDNDSRTLFKKAQELCSEIGLQLVYGDSLHWFLRADAWSDFSTTSPDAACGHNIEIWSPKGQQVLAWRKLQNEIQMEWFIHPIQEQRQQRGEKIVNGLWLWAGTLLPQNIASENSNPIHFNCSATEFIQSPQLTLLNQLTSPALAGDWGAWAQQMIELEHTWFKPLYSALKTRRLKNIDLILSNSNTLLNIQTSSNSLRQFWRSANFNSLI